MKPFANAIFAVAIAAISLASCTDDTSSADTNFDNKALFDEIQNSLVDRNISVEEFSEMTTNVEGTPQFFREFEDLTFEEFTDNNSRLSNADMHAKLLSLQEKLNIHMTSSEH